MKHDKAFYRALKPSNGYVWGGYDADAKLHCFQTGDYRTGFKEIRCRESEITDGSLELLIRLGMTR